MKIKDLSKWPKDQYPPAPLYFTGRCVIDDCKVKGILFEWHYYSGHARSHIKVCQKHNKQMRKLYVQD